MNDENRKIAESLHRMRYAMYRLLGGLLAEEPDEAILDLSSSDAIANVCAFIGGDVARLRAEIAALASRRDACESLRSEYTRLFVGPGRLPVPPWESAHVGAEPLVFTSDTLDVRNAYRSAGYVAKGYPHEADDHIATELSFMASLAAETADAHAAGDYSRATALTETQSAFLERHLGRWVGRFAEGLAEQERVSRFYPATAELAALFCNVDEQVLSDIESSRMQA